jgi:hypothetical protein
VVTPCETRACSCSSGFFPLYKKGLIERGGSWDGAGDLTLATLESVAWYNN